MVLKAKKGLVVQPDVEELQEDILVDLTNFFQATIIDEEEFTDLLLTLIEEEEIAEKIDKRITEQHPTPNAGP